MKTVRIVMVDLSVWHVPFTELARMHGVMRTSALFSEARTRGAEPPTTWSAAAREDFENSLLREDESNDVLRWAQGHMPWEHVAPFARRQELPEKPILSSYAEQWPDAEVFITTESTLPPRDEPETARCSNCV